VELCPKRNGTIMSESIYNLVPYEEPAQEKKHHRVTSKATKPVVPYSTFGTIGIEVDDLIVAHWLTHCYV
jgi:hypothetical protein